MIPLKTLKAEMLANPKVRAAYDAMADEFEMAHELIAARSRAGLTQADVGRARRREHPFP
jgi:predicted anti-sigma-YlaC factor YlaD